MRRTDRQVHEAEDLRAILAEADCCHLAMVDDGAPYLVTMNFGFDWEGEWPVLYFHCAPMGRKIDVLRAQPRVCFSVDTGHELVTADQACGFGMRYRSLVGFGTVEFVSGEGDRRHGLDRIMARFAGPGPFSYDPRVLATTTVLKLTVTELTGKVKS